MGEEPFSYTSEQLECPLVYKCSSDCCPKTENWNHITINPLQLRPKIKPNLKEITECHHTVFNRTFSCHVCYYISGPGIIHSKKTYKTIFLVTAFLTNGWFAGYLMLILMSCGHFTYRENHPLNIEQKSLWAYGWAGQDSKEKNPSLSQQLYCGYAIHNRFHL